MPRYPEYQIHSLDTHGYGRIIQTIDGKFYDGWGNTVTFTLFGKEVSINVEGVETDSTDGGNINITNNNTTNNNTTNNTDLFQDLQNQINDLTTTIKNQQTTINNTVPTGTIIMWGGSEAGIPSGWKLCDGSTLYDVNAKLRQQLKDQGNPFGEWQGSPLLPDLRSRFVVGAGNSTDGTNLTPNGSHYGVGDKGGESLHTLTPDETPLRKHNHSLMSPIYSNQILRNPGTVDLGVLRNNDSTANIASSGSHTHTIRTHYQSGLGSGISTTKSLNEPNDSSPDRISGGNHQHSKESFDGYTGTSETNTTILPHENRPPYFALCYIIKL